MQKQNCPLFSVLALRPCLASRCSSLAVKCGWIYSEHIMGHL